MRNLYSDMMKSISYEKLLPDIYSLYIYLIVLWLILFCIIKIYFDDGKTSSGLYRVMTLNISFFDRYDCIWVWKFLSVFTFWEVVLPYNFDVNFEGGWLVKGEMLRGKRLDYIVYGYT